MTLPARSPRRELAAIEGSGAARVVSRPLAQLGQSPRAETHEWPTPAPLFAALDAEFGFTLDPCATADNAKCARYFTRDDDGIVQPWAPHVVFMNPPYGRDIAAWVGKARREFEAGAVVVALIPSRTDTAWWHRHVMAADEIRFIVGRVKFGTSAINAPFPSAVVVWASGRGSSGPRVSSYAPTAGRQRPLVEAVQ